MTAADSTADLTLYLVAQDLLGRYAHGVDHGDLELALDTFWPDATDHHGDIWNGNAHEYLRDMNLRLNDARTGDAPMDGPGFQHHLTTIMVRRTGVDDARVQAAYLAYVPLGSGSGSGPDRRVGLVVGRFLDHLQRRNGVWKILSRNVVNDFTDGDVGKTLLPSGSWQHGGYTAGGWGPTDPGIAFLGSGTRR